MVTLASSGMEEEALLSGYGIVPFIIEVFSARWGRNI